MEDKDKDLKNWVLEDKNDFLHRVAEAINETINNNLNFDDLIIEQEEIKKNE